MTADDLTAQDSPETAEDELVMAMPRRLLYGIQGFVQEIDIDVIEVLANEHWFGQPQVIHDDFDAKEVRIGLVLRRSDGQWLIAENGEGVFILAVPSSATRLGNGIKCLKELARLAAEGLLQHSLSGSVLKGYLHDDKDPDLKHYFIMMYVVTVNAEQKAPEGTTWVGEKKLQDIPLDPLSIQILSELKMP